MAKLTPEWAGGMSSDAYKDAYTNVVDINSTLKERMSRGIPTQGPEAVSESNDLNTSATMDNTQAVKELTSALSGGSRGGGRPTYARPASGAMGKRK